MTAAVTVVCACCQTRRPAAETYERVPFSGERFCTDAAGCRRRMAGVGDPVAEVGAVAVTAPSAVPGARCAVCGTVDPPGGAYARGAAYMCLDMAGCRERSVEYQYLTAWGDSSPDRLISSAEMRALQAAAPAEVPAERAPLSPEEMARLAAADDLGRKTVPPDGALEARLTEIARR